MRLALAVAGSTLLQMQYSTKCYIHIGRNGSYPRRDGSYPSLCYKEISMMTRWVTDVSCEFSKISQAVCGSSEQWAQMSKVPESALSKKKKKKDFHISIIDGSKLQTQTFYVIWGDPSWTQITAAWSYLWMLQCGGLKHIKKEDLWAKSRLKWEGFKFEE